MHSPPSRPENPRREILGGIEAPFNPNPAHHLPSTKVVTLPARALIYVVPRFRRTARRFFSAPSFSRVAALSTLCTFFLSRFPPRIYNVCNDMPALYTTLANNSVLTCAAFRRSFCLFSEHTRSLFFETREEYEKFHLSSAEK